ncbi:SH3 domain-containing protein [Acidipropionibacterium virtanenii]|uniref:SH3b domain-containing protein n=1 Tax=Acidipropionibacterium virtanenii TaxID=2057246 RepID=A0A344URT3_9ACTN|nr:SH3 domain-containing protein [Acidipropionibacterium virtanenii]AXE37981.1 hypothetical protein JS278_00793 [Acidipropionibacterium virtanenii]
MGELHPFRIGVAAVAGVGLVAGSAHLLANSVDDQSSRPPAQHSTPPATPRASWSATPQATSTTTTTRAPATTAAPEADTQLQLAAPSAVDPGQDSEPQSLSQSLSTSSQERATSQETTASGDRAATGGQTSTSTPTPRTTTAKKLQQKQLKTSPAPESKSTARSTVTSTDYLNVRSAPSTSASRVGLLSPGDSVETTGRLSDGFQEIVYRGTARWASASSLKAVPAAETSTDKTADKSTDTSSSTDADSGAAPAATATSATATPKATTSAAPRATASATPESAAPKAKSSTRTSAGARTSTKSATTSAGKTVYTSTAVNLRSGAGTTYRTYGLLAAGKTLTTRGAVVNGWTPVSYNGRAGWVNTSYLTTTKPAVTKPTPAKPATSIVYATTSVNVRSTASTSGKLLGTLNRGDHVGTRGAAVNGWTPVSYKGTAAWVSSSYLSATRPATTSTSSSSAAGKTVYTSTAVNLRSGAGTTYRTYGLLAAGKTLTTRGAAVNGWTPVSYNGRAGWVNTSYLTTTKPAASSSNSSASGKTVYTSTAVNLRSGAGTTYRTYGLLAAGKTLTTRGAAVNGWTPVSYNGRAGWVNTSYLTTTKPAASSSNSSASGKTVYTSTAVNLRSGAGTTYRTYGLLAAGKTLTTRGAAVNGWTPVSYNGRAGWVNTSYLTTTKPAASSSNSSASGKTVYTSTAVNLRSGAGTTYRTYGLLAAGKTLTTRGAVVNGWTPVSYNGRAGWVNTSYLTTTKPAASSSGSSSSWATLTANGSSGLSGLRPNAVGIVNRVLTAFPQIKTVYGVRSDSIDDHPSGHAVDLMLPRGTSDRALGQQIANYFRAHAKELNVQYVMWNKQIWNISRNSEGWRAVADRGSATANHMDHVHITTVWD